MPPRLPSLPAPFLCAARRCAALPQLFLPALRFLRRVSLRRRFPPAADRSGSQPGSPGPGEGEQQQPPSLPNNYTTKKPNRRNELKKNPLKITVILAVPKRTKDLQWRGKLKGRCSGTRGREGAPNLASHLASHLASLGARRAAKVKPAAQHSQSAAQPPPMLPQRVLSPSLKGENRSAAAARRPGLTESSVFGGKCGNASVCGRLLLYHWGTKPPALSGPSLCCGVRRAGG